MRITKLSLQVREAFGTPMAALLSLLATLIVLPMAYITFDWLILGATWPWQSAELCQGAAGACWPFVVEKFNFILFGTYPHEQLWRPALTSLILCALTVQTGLQMVAKGLPLGLRGTILVWALCLCASFVLMAGGIAGLARVDSVHWNGLPILLILSIVAIALAFPLGVILTMARHQCRYPLLARLAAIYVETARGVPMLTVLFVGVFVLPLTLPVGTHISPVTATLFALVLFHAAYFAEDVRSGLEGLHKGQTDAAHALGLNFRKMMALVLLPQALRRALPAILNSVIGAYKDTSLVIILGIHDLTATARMSFSDPGWRGYALEAYLIVGVWFLISCAFMSMIGRAVQQRAPGS